MFQAIILWQKQQSLEQPEFHIGCYGQVLGVKTVNDGSVVPCGSLWFI